MKYGQILDSEWVPCPICGTKTHIKVYEDTVMINFPLYCQKCREETRINVVQMKMLLSDEPST